MRIRVNCLSCGHPMDLGDAYEDYHGEVRCWGCRAVLEVTLAEGKLKAMTRSGARAARAAEPPAAGHETR
jgi:DNA-directed RNA polymerase subunit N (RpoN/RPB10)